MDVFLFHWFYHFIHITALALHSAHFHSFDAWSNYVLLVMEYYFLSDLCQYFTAEADKYT